MPLRFTFCHLGLSPLSNALISSEQIHQVEPCYPLHPLVCEGCRLVQLPEYQRPEEIFKDYHYFSSYSVSWLEHARTYANQMVTRFGLSRSSQVVEIASNDGYLLQYFKERAIPVMGVEPAENVAEVARKKGIPTEVRFLGAQSAREMSEEGIAADLLIGNNVLAHVPELHDFVFGLKYLLKPTGCITLEFPHLLQLIRHNQFDTIYHEHFSYFSFLTAERLFLTHDLKVFDVEELDTHGGSLRIYICHGADQSKSISDAVTKIKIKEIDAGMNKMETYTAFSEKVLQVRGTLLEFLISLRHQKKTIAGYGAPAKGTTLLNYCGIGTDLLEYTVDISPEKQGRLLPGCHIPIYHPDKIKETKPDFLLILPWNIKEEIMEQMSFIREWGGKFVLPIPKVTVIS